MVPNALQTVLIQVNGAAMVSQRVEYLKIFSCPQGTGIISAGQKRLQHMREGGRVFHVGYMARP